MDATDKFYLGRRFDATAGQTTQQPLLYDPADLTTHAVIVGMTGSGKTGLCINLMEEAALHGTPVLMIDPKGDITNALLHFPDLAPADFEPWVDAWQAQREGKTAAEVASETASRWREGLAQWGITPERIRQLRDSAQFAVYTPGSDAGLPLSILASLAAPELPWAEHRELLREQISGTVTALLGLVGIKDVDPLRSREHILLANVFEHAWSQGRDLDLGELILQTQSPPFAKLGFFDVNTFFPEKDRFELAMRLNSILAAPAFQPWIEGEPLDVGRLLYQSDGRPRHTVFYIAHLSDSERMFFVTLLYSAVETWMRRQSGTPSLRALVYFDEIFGYLPPLGNPPSKLPMLRLLKQARAFGVGMVLATQNPVDVDYKALSNAGTWFIGKLATEQDKERLLDGLTSAGLGGVDRGQYDRMISALGKRVFLLRNVHESQPELFQTRWAMNFLAGPITRNRIADLNRLAGAQPGTAGASPRGPAAPAPGAAPEAAGTSSELTGSLTRPAVPSGVQEYFLPLDLDLARAAAAGRRALPAGAETLGLLYRPALLAQGEALVRNRKYQLDSQQQRAVLVHEPDRRGAVRWEDHPTPVLEPRRLEPRPAPDGRFAELEPPLTEARTLRDLENDFLDWLYRTCEVKVRAHEGLKVYGGPEEPAEAFAARCRAAADEAMREEARKVAADFDRRIDIIEDKLRREQRELEEDQAELAGRQRDELLTHAQTLFSLFGKRRSSLSSSMSKRRMSSKAKAEVEESEQAIVQYQQQLAELQREAETALQGVQQRWARVAEEITEIPQAPLKKDVRTTLFGVAWCPYYLVRADGRVVELPAFGQG